MLYTGTDTICAWCLAERGEMPQDGDSHGICPDHADSMRFTQAQRTLDRFEETPSYVERFKDEKKGKKR
jgi:hypothetical protein